MDGQNGKSAYELAQEQGYQGSLQDWLNSLVGEAGKDGADGQDGQNGKSAYELAVENGYTGTESMWLASLIGATGATGEKGEKGETGETGADGRGIQSITLTASEMESIPIPLPIPMARHPPFGLKTERTEKTGPMARMVQME